MGVWCSIALVSTPFLLACGRPQPASMRDGGARETAVDAPVDAAADASAADATADAATDDAGDGSTSDASRDDAGTVGDAGAADARTDAPDAASDDCGDLGKPCGLAGGCTSGYACDDFRGVCLPSGRPICGGFVGAPCPDGLYRHCRYLMHADFGPCLTAAEAECACTALRDLFVCE
ncbi:MAG: hypothetical protein NZ898_07185 [Myxococcota bacterium]|nr:hypothetical protein [Myxococcota bacterium]MDW8362593.1 hypothetical protein [Myxococcales bacterium]